MTSIYALVHPRRIRQHLHCSPLAFHFNTRHSSSISNSPSAPHSLDSLRHSPDTMDHRGEESPMDFQWDNQSGRVDPNSPFRMSGIESTYTPVTPVKKSKPSLLYPTRSTPNILQIPPLSRANIPPFMPPPSSSPPSPAPTPRPPNPPPPTANASPHHASKPPPSAPPTTPPTTPAPPATPTSSTPPAPRATPTRKPPRPTCTSSTSYAASAAAYQDSQ